MSKKTFSCLVVASIAMLTVIMMLILRTHDSYYQSRLIAMGLPEDQLVYKLMPGQLRDTASVWHKLSFDQLITAHAFAKENEPELKRMAPHIAVTEISTNDLTQRRFLVKKADGIYEAEFSMARLKGNKADASLTLLPVRARKADERTAVAAIAYLSIPPAGQSAPDRFFRSDWLGVLLDQLSTDQQERLMERLASATQEPTGDWSGIAVAATGFSSPQNLEENTEKGNQFPVLSCTKNGAKLECADAIMVVDRNLDATTTPLRFFCFQAKRPWDCATSTSAS